MVFRVPTQLPNQKVLSQIIKFEKMYSLKNHVQKFTLFERLQLIKYDKKDENTLKSVIFQRNSPINVLCQSSD